MHYAHVSVASVEADGPDYVRTSTAVLTYHIQPYTISTGLLTYTRLDRTYSISGDDNKLNFYSFPTGDVLSLGVLIKSLVIETRGYRTKQNGDH